jgi:hypothetical protein
MSFRAVARGFCCSPPRLVPARSRFARRIWWLRGIGPALAGRLGGGGAFALCAREFVVRLQCSFRPGPAAAGCGCDVGGDGGFELSVARSAGSVLHSQVGSGKDGAFALRAMEIVVRLQCSFRPDPAAAGCWWGKRNVVC